MRNDAPDHVPPIQLWQCLCGGPELSRQAVQHVLLCQECETLAKEITDALNDIESAVRQPQAFVS